MPWKTTGHMRSGSQDQLQAGDACLPFKRILVAHARRCEAGRSCLNGSTPNQTARQANNTLLTHAHLSELLFWCTRSTAASAVPAWVLG